MQAREQFEEHRFQQHAMLGSLERTDIKIEAPNSDGPIVLQHPSFGNVSLAPRGYFSEGDFNAIQGLLNGLIRHETGVGGENSESTSVAPIHTAAVGPSIWTPAPGEHLMFFDTSTLQNMCAQAARKEHSWLELLKSTARLPDITVVIPARIADWEMLGCIPVLDSNGKRTGFEQADKYHLRRDMAEYTRTVTKFIDSASRGRLMPDGSIHIEGGGNPNIIVLETAEDDKALNDIIRNILHQPEHLQTRLVQSEVDNKGKGEESINYILERLPEGVSASIISDDIWYLKNAPHYTGAGIPVAHASTPCYLDAEFTVRAPLLRKDLKETEALTIVRLNKLIKTNSKPGRVPRLHPYCKEINPQGSILAEEPHETIYGLIHRQVEKQLEKKMSSPETHAAVASAASRWTGIAPRNAVAASPINPASVENRTENGPRARL